VPEKLISVIVPAYNHEKYVEETISSIIAQTIKNLELIIIDDGSKDHTMQKIQQMEDECKKRFVHFSYQTQENQGTCRTMNKLIGLAQGEYVALIASDDKYTPNALSDMAKVLDENADVSLAVGRNLIMDGDSKVCYWDKKRNNVYDKKAARYLDFTQFLSKSTGVDFASDKFGSYEQLVKQNHIGNGYLIRKNIFEKTGLFTPQAPLEDHWLMLQIAKFAKMKFIDVPTFYYRWHSANTISQRDKMAVLAAKTFEWEYETLLKNKDDEHLKMFEKRNVRYLIKTPIFSVLKEKNRECRKIFLRIGRFDILLSKKARR